MTDQATWNTIGPAPREVPLALRLQWLISRTTAAGAIVLGVGLGLMVLGLQSMRPLALLRLATAGRETNGDVTSVERAFSLNDRRPFFRYRYVYRTPDGIARRGHSFKPSRPWIRINGPPAAAARAAKQPPGTIVQYDPEHPELSRINGQVLGVVEPPDLALPLIAALVGLAVAWYGIVRGARRLRLLEHGALAQATLVSARLTDHDERDGGEHPFAEVRERLLARQAAGLTAADALPEPARGMAHGFVKLWTAGVVVIIGFGVVFLIGALAALSLGWVGAGAINGQPADRTTMQAFLGGFLVVWVGVGILMLQGGRKVAGFLSGHTAVPAHPHGPPVQCTFEFRPPGGAPVRATETLPFDERLGAEGTEPVLYDPDRPSRALLLSAVRSSVAVSEFGGWLPTETIGPGIRVLLVVTCLLAAPWGAWALWHAL